MEIVKQILKVDRMARVYSIGKPKPTIRVLLFALHGYGQLAYYFIQHFKNLAEEFPVRVVAPEGLSRFYLDGKYQRVGASWMTREDRMLEIEEQNRYLNQVLAQELDQAAVGSIAIHVLGFSQGTATAWRWVASSDIAVEQLILWAGMIPNEPHKRLTPNRIIPVLGTRDIYFSGLRRDEYLKVLEKSDLIDQLLVYDGDHRIDLPTLNQIYKAYFQTSG